MSRTFQVRRRLHGQVGLLSWLTRTTQIAGAPINGANELRPQTSYIPRMRKSSICSEKKLIKQSLVGLRWMIEVTQATTTQLSSVEIQVAPQLLTRDLIAAGKLQKRAAANSRKSLEILIVSAVLSLQWAPLMPQLGRAKILCNAVIKS